MPYRESAAPSILVVAVGPYVVGAAKDTGKTVWRHTVGSTRGATPVVRVALDGERLVVGCGHALHCLDPKSGALLWKVDSPVETRTLLAEGDRIYVAYGGEVACFDREGALQWHELLCGVDAPVTLLAGGVIVHADLEGT